ncbi:unnamed protein product [Rangifer tarandus platyrhynchus]|uniref:Uncharacterized protein n=1 Tax=Rangifer tarandus platyrhynchus TaxID=3082113 RepID=A0ABN8YH36_RANTA|nr:unnamed protein product [Rangifer tarandus platyrhynchus]
MKPVAPHNPSAIPEEEGGAGDGPAAPLRSKTGTRRFRPQKRTASREGSGTPVPLSGAHRDDVTPAREAPGIRGSSRGAGLRFGSGGRGTTLPRSLRGGATRAARGCDWLMSRPHAEELKKPLCCDRARAARPSELGEGALEGGGGGGGCRPVRG